MSARSERDRLARELEAARRRIAELETALLRRERDALTAVLRIEAFREQLVEELQRTRRRGLRGALVVLQVDRLADIHRDHGFATGDALLGALVEALRTGTRAEDLLGRMGDDRFALLLRDAGEEATRACIARLLGDLRELVVGPIRGVSASAGVVLFGADDDDPVALFETAGRALADAQAGGGGRAVIATADGAGLGVAAELAAGRLARGDSERVRALRDRLHAALAAAVPGLRLNGHPTERLPNTLNVSFPDVDGEELLVRTPEIAASTGSACHAGRTEPSAVLLAMGLDRARALGAVRLSLGYATTEADIAVAASALARAAIDMAVVSTR